jgi:hypothetical protein
MAWACFEGRLIQRRPAREIATQMGITANCVFVHASRVLDKVRHRCDDIKGEPFNESGDDPS